MYSLEQIWRFLSVQISQSDIIIDKMRELDEREHKEGDEAEEFSTIGDGFSDKDAKGELHQREQATLQSNQK